MKPVMLLSLLFIIQLSPGCRKRQENDPIGVAREKAASREDNTHFDRLVAGQQDDGDRAAEARAWLDPKNTSNALWKTSRAQTQKMVDDLYTAGAVKVLAVYAPHDETIKVNLCAELLIVLPTDAVVRKKVFKSFNLIDKQLWGEDHENIKDEGQKYLDLNMDP